MRWPALPERARAQGSPPPRRRAGPEGASRAYRHRPVPWRRRQRKRPDRGQADNDPRIIATDADGDGRERRSHKALMTVWSNCCTFPYRTLAGSSGKARSSSTSWSVSDHRSRSLRRFRPPEDLEARAISPTADTNPAEPCRILRAGFCMRPRAVTCPGRSWLRAARLS